MIEVRGRPAAIRKAYDLFSIFYGGIVTRFEKPAIEAGLKHASVRRGERVLDAGCGPGNVLAKIEQQVGPQGMAVGIDFAPRMLAAARRRVSGARLVQADAHQLPFAAGTFDLVWSSYMLDLLPTADLTPVLREFSRILRPGGRMTLVAFTKPGERLTWWERAYLRTPAWLVPYVFGSCRPVRLRPFVEEAGFVGIESEDVPRGMRSEIVTARRPTLTGE
jgi:ubiquinone/menaquinone biosynthesis C-methylase UbiE